jgi:hypothetical protein
MINRVTNFLLDSEESLWYNEIWMPALIHTLPSDELQEIPTSWDAAAARSRAKALETFSFQETTFYSQQQLLSTILLPQYLHKIWMIVLRRLTGDIDKYHMFQGCEVFLNSKNLKMQSKSISWSRLSTSWDGLWGATIDSSFIDRSRFWIDVGRQFTPPDHFLRNDSIDQTRHTPETYVWRRCCVNSYAQQRRLNLPKSHLQLSIYQSAAFHDMLSMTLTPSPKSAEHREGLIYSQFYMKDKVNFVSATTSLFTNADLESLAFDPEYVKAIIHNSGSGRNLSTRRLVKAYLAGKVRAHSSLQDARKRSFGAREEHRVSLELWDQVLPELIRREQENTLGTASTVAEQPFFVVPSNAYFGVVYGQMNKFCLGFEYALSRVNSEYTTWEDTQAAILFLRSLQRSFSTSIVQQEPVLWKDRWKRQIGTDKPPTTHQGLNIGALSGRTGFGWFSPLFDWSSWRLKDQYVPVVLQEHPRLLQHYQAKRASLLDKHTIFIRLQLIERWWHKHSSVAGIKLALVEYLCGLCIAQFRRDVWGFLLKMKEVSKENKTHLMTADVPLCYHTLKLYLVDTEPWFVTGNKADVKTIPSLAAYLFDEEPYVVDLERAKGIFKDRRHWDNKAYRIIFHRCVALLNRAANQDWAKLLGEMVKGSVSAQNYVLPYPDHGGLLSKTKCMRGRAADTEVKSRHIWAAVWVKDTGPASLLRELGLTERCLASDANQIMERARDDDILRMGGKLEANADVELAIPYTSLYTAEWHGLPNDELEEKLCHDAIHLADREAQLVTRWQTLRTSVPLDDGARLHGLRSRPNTEGLEANIEPDTLSSDAPSHQGSDDEWDSTLNSDNASSGYESEYNPRRRSRPKTTSKKKAAGRNPYSQRN